MPFGFSLTGIKKINILVSHLVYFILLRFSSGHLSSVKFICIAQALPGFFLNNSVKLILKTYDTCFIDKFMEFLVGKSSLQRPYTY